MTTAPAIAAATWGLASFPLIGKASRPRAERRQWHPAQDGADQPAEVAVTVLDHWQSEGLRTVLLQRLAHRAGEEDIRYFHGNVLAENQAALELSRWFYDSTSCAEVVAR